jgi:hypothetical protein
MDERYGNGLVGIHMTAFRVSISPIVTSDMAALTLSAFGKTLVICGQELDLSDMEDGDTLPAAAVGSDFVNDPIAQENGVIFITLLFPIRYGAPYEARFPSVIDVDQDGIVTLPPNGD